MDHYLIYNEGHSLSAKILPAYGGMVSEWTMDGKNLLRLDEGELMTAPMAGGGMPVLFPFSSRTKEDCYLLDGQAWRMPMHGLLKNGVFAVSYADEHSVTLWTESNSVWRSQYYPFDFRLEITYALSGRQLDVKVRVINRSSRDMPHTLGLHPFFRASDKTAVSLEHSMTVHYDYMKGLDLPLCDISDLSARWDDVFHTSPEPGFTLENRADGFKVRCIPDMDFQSLVVCSWIRGAVCVEPWIGLPDSANHGRLLAFVPAGAEKTYHVIFEAFSLEQDA